MKETWRTAWQGRDIVVYCNESEVDRLHAEDIARVVLVYNGSGDSPGDLVRTLVEVGDDWLVLSADTGFAGRVNFERQDFWSERRCVYWAPDARAPLPLRLKRGRWLRGAPAYARVPRAELAPLVERWPLQGPQTWEQRKWRRIARSRPFAPDDPMAA